MYIERSDDMYKAESLPAELVVNGHVGQSYSVDADLRHEAGQIYVPEEWARTYQAETIPTPSGQILQAGERHQLFDGRVTVTAGENAVLHQYNHGYSFTGVYVEYDGPIIKPAQSRGEGDPRSTSYIRVGRTSKSVETGLVVSHVGVKPKKVNWADQVVNGDLGLPTVKSAEFDQPTVYRAQQLAAKLLENYDQGGVAIVAHGSRHGTDFGPVTIVDRTGGSGVYHLGHHYSR